MAAETGSDDDQPPARWPIPDPHARRSMLAVQVHIEPAVRADVVDPVSHRQCAPRVSFALPTVPAVPGLFRRPTGYFHILPFHRSARTVAFGCARLVPPTAQALSAEVAAVPVSTPLADGAAWLRRWAAGCRALRFCRG
jgi:hypothetical protein